MPRTNRNQIFANGVLVDETLVTIDDATITREEAPTRIRQAVATLQSWASDEQAINTSWASLTATQKDNANKQLHQRIGIFFDRFGDLLVALNMDRQQ